MTPRVPSPASVRAVHQERSGRWPNSFSRSAHDARAVDTTESTLTENVPGLLSIGLPVYNGGASLQQALVALRAQTYPNIEIVISDNASTDETPDICRAHAEQDARIVYHRNEANLGPLRNFARVLIEARGEYFMWAGHDDWWAPHYVEANVAILRDHPDAVASVSKVRLVPPSPSGELDGGTFALMGSIKENVTRYLMYPGMNSRFYGAIRRIPLLKSFNEDDFRIWGGDLLVIVKLLRYGKFYEVPEYLFSRNNNYVTTAGIARAQGYILHGRMAKVLPLAAFTRRVLAEDHVPHSPRVILALLRHNLVHMYHAAKVLWYSRLRG